MTTLGDLTLQDIGRRLRIRSDTTIIEGQFRGLDAQTDWIEETSLEETNVDPIPSRQTATIVIGLWSASGLPLNSEVTFL